MPNDESLKSRRILIVSPDLDYYKDNRGIFRYSLRLGAALKALGYEIHLLTSASLSGIPKKRAYTDTLRCLAIIDHLSKRDKSEKVGQRYSAFSRARRLLSRVRRLLAQIGLRFLERPTLVRNMFSRDDLDLVGPGYEVVSLFDAWLNLQDASSDIVEGRFSSSNAASGFKIDASGYSFVFTTQPYRIRIRGSRLVSVYHDLFPVLSNIHPAKMNELGLDFIGNSVSSDYIVCISETTRLALRNLLHYNSFLEEEKVRVVRQSVKRAPEELVSSSMRTETNNRSFVTIGTLEPRKNQAFVYELFVDEESLADCTLNLVGSADISYLRTRLPGIYRACSVLFNNNAEALQEAILDGASFSVRYKNILWHCNASEENKNMLLTGSNAMIFSSFNEGYGIPIVEGMALGIPVIANDIPVFRGISQDLYFYRQRSELLSLILELSGSTIRSDRYIDSATQLVDDKCFAEDLKKAIPGLGNLG